MKASLEYRHATREELASYLAQQEIQTAEALTEGHLYRCRCPGGESLVVSLANGDGLIIQGITTQPVDRRRRAR